MNADPHKRVNNHRGTGWQEGTQPTKSPDHKLPGCVANQLLGGRFSTSVRLALNIISWGRPPNARHHRAAERPHKKRREPCFGASGASRCKIGLGLPVTSRLRVGISPPPPLISTYLEHLLKIKFTLTQWRL